MEKKVAFYSEGCKIAGTLFIPDNIPAGEKRSAIVFCGGFTGSRDTVLLPFSRYLCEKGYVGLSLDYRAFGESEGPRWRLIPMEEVEDVRNGITFLQQQPQVDPARIGLIGTSYGGSIGVYVSAIDERVKCAAVNVPAGNGRKWMRSLRNNWEWQSLLDEIKEDRVRRALTGISQMVPQPHILVQDPEGRAANEAKLKKDPKACTHLPLETAEAVIDFAPDEVVHKIAPRPLLFTVAERDVVAPIELIREMYDKAGEPKKFAIIRGCSHYATYSPPYLQLVLDEMLAWFQRFLP